MSTLTPAAGGMQALETATPTAPLGALLVSRGLLSEEQLGDALADQAQVGGPLGAILVERGLVRPSVVAQALATQHGAILKTEYGFATGFDTCLSVEEAPAHPPVSPAPAGIEPLLRLGPRTSPAPAASPAPVAAALSPAGQPRLEALETELASAVAENEKLRARLGQMQVEALRSHSESEARRQEAAIVGARVAGLEAAVATLHAERAQLQARVDELHPRR